ncbi:MAG: PQQ-binding-like beta-propeller repeat protein [Planctomycetota bacterium]
MTAPPPLATLLHGLAESGREGTLTVRDGERRVDLYAARSGVRLVASGQRRGVRIGQVLLKAGKISQRQLDLVLERQLKSNLRFGELLYLMAQITEDEIRQAIRSQIQEEILDLFLLTEAQSSFVEGPPPQELFEEAGPVTEHPFPIPPLLEEGSRRASEWEAFGTRVPRADLALSKAPPNPGKSELPLDDRTLQIIELCDGRRGVEQVVEVSPKFRFETLKAISYLVSVGRILPGGRVVAVATPTEQLKRDFLGAGPAPAPALSPGAPESLASSPAPKPAQLPPQPMTRFGLESVPDVDWEEEKRTSRAPGAEPESRQATPKPAAFTDGPTFEPKPDTNPASPPGFLKKEETSRLMARNAAQAIAHRPPPLLPPEPRPRARARWGWLAAAVLFAALAGAATWEFLARHRFTAVDEQARASRPAEARRLYDEFARAWPWSSPAQAARRAAEDLAGGKADAEAAEALRAFAEGRIDTLERMGLDDETGAVQTALKWAEENREAALAARCKDRLAKIVSYRAGAAALLSEYRTAVKDGRVADARKTAERLRAEFGRAPQAGVAVRVETSPALASVEAGGVKAGLSPCLVEVPDGDPLVLRATLDGHEPVFMFVASPQPEVVSILLPRAPRWTARASAAVRLRAATTAAGVFIVSADGTMVALASGDGHALWRARAASLPWITPPVAARGAILAGAQDGSIWALDASEGTLLWRESAGSGLRGVLAPSGDGSTVFAAPAEGGVAAIETATGSVLGRAELSSAVVHGPFALGETSWAVALADGSVVSGTPGRVSWTTKLSSPCAAAAAASEGLFCATTDGAVTLIGADGAVRWTKPSPGAVYGGVAAALTRGVALLSKRRLACYDLSNGGVLWTADLPADACAPPVLGDLLALVPCEDGFVRAIGAADGSTRWSFRAGQAVKVPATQGPAGAAISGDNGEVWFVP